MTIRTAIPPAGLLVLVAVTFACAGGSSRTATTSTPGASIPQPSAPITTSAPATATAPSPSPAGAATPVGAAYRAIPVFPMVNFAQMLALQVIPGDERRALVMTKDGLIRRAELADATAAPAVFLDISAKLIKDPGLEEGLLGLAFAPDYATSGRFYLYYSAGNPRRAVLSRFVATGDRADPASEHVLLQIDEPYANHNGGALAFGPDGNLYIGIGDGGSGGDPHGNGQNLDTLLGKILRIDVSGPDYAIPPGNPFAAGGGRPEIWASGLRNPWRISFDPQNGRLWAADVGQNLWEEVDVIEKGGDYGWNIMEGNHCYHPVDGCRTDGLILPQAEYGHNLGCSITGGFVYHGAAMPELRGWYLYGDYCSGRVWALNAHDVQGAPSIELANTGASITSFAADAQGEPYLVTFDGTILKLERK
jgi:glucose/arabinose dehydrogenase